MDKAKDLSAGLIACFVLLTAGRQFFGPRAQPVVIVDYAPAVLLLLVLSILGLTEGTGSWQMVAGLVLSVAASLCQALGVDTFSPLDRNGLYHLVLMAATVSLFLGGLQLSGG